MDFSSPYNHTVLLTEIAEGSKNAFRELYDHYHQKVYSFAFFMTRSSHIAEEITQEVFIRIWMHRSKLGTVINFSAWLRTVVRNLTYTHLHRIAQDRIAMLNIRNHTSDTDNRTETSIIDREYNKLLEQAIDNLPKQQKKVYQLSCQEGMKQETIAQTLGLSINTIKNHRKAAIHSIRIYLENHIDVIVMLVISPLFAHNSWS